MDSTPHDATRSLVTPAQQELDRYRVEVRDRAIKGFRDGFFTLDSLNETLLDLGLESYAPTYVTEVPFTLQLTLRTDAPPHDAQDLRDQLSYTKTLSALRLAVARVLAEQGGERLTVATGGANFYTNAPRQIMVIED